jgi:hypothetical protein
MSAAPLLLAKKTSTRPAPRPQDLRPRAENLLRELAFVYHAVRAVKQSMTESRS